MQNIAIITDSGCDLPESYVQQCENLYVLPLVVRLDDGEYRSGVDIDTEGGITNVGYTRDGERLEYTVDAANPGSFTLALKAANPDTAAKSVKVYLDGTPAGEI
jgi:hypothetical protein